MINVLKLLFDLFSILRSVESKFKSIYLSVHLPAVLTGVTSVTFDFIPPPATT